MGMRIWVGLGAACVCCCVLDAAKRIGCRPRAHVCGIGYATVYHRIASLLSPHNQCHVLLLTSLLLLSVVNPPAATLLQIAGW
jgi:hypothetical protein